MFVSHRRRATGLGSCLMLLAVSVAADEGSSRPAYAATGVTLDDADNTSISGELGMPLGPHAWALAGFGKNETEGGAESGVEELNADVLSLGFGFSGRHLEFSTLYIQRDDAAFNQDDWAFALDWRGERGGIGADGFVRSADAETTASVLNRRRQPRSVRIVESLDATGFGLHGDIDVSEHVNLFASAMAYDYDDVDSNHPYLSRLLFLGGSGVTRDQAFLEQSFGVGGTYRFSTISVTTQYLRDEALETGDITNTGELSTLILLGDHWSLTPLVGYSDSELDGGIGYGGFTLGFAW